MALRLTNFFRFVPKTGTRSMSDNIGPKDVAASASAGEHGSIARWKKLTFFAALPGIMLCWLNAYLKEKEHHEEWERPEFIKYAHLYLRTRKFPWGDGNHSLFHNPKVNALPDGYEEVENTEDH